MNAKFTNFEIIAQVLPAGIALNDHNIEFVGDPASKSVIWMRCGNAHSFEVLPRKIFKALKKLFLSDDDAVRILTKMYVEAINDIGRLVEIYTYYMYGHLDHKADVINGKLQSSDNSRDFTNCISLKFKHKRIMIGSYVLTRRDLVIIDDVYAGMPNKVTADKLGIALSTLDFHKRNLFQNIGATHQTHALKLAFQSQVVC